MAKDTTLSLRIDRKLSDMLTRQARQRKRSKSSLAAIAIENYFKIEAQEIERIKQSLEAVKAGAPTVPNEEVMQWVQSWGTDKELPMPKPRKRA